MFYTATQHLRFLINFFITIVLGLNYFEPYQSFAYLPFFGCLINFTIQFWWYMVPNAGARITNYKKTLLEVFGQTVRQYILSRVRDTHKLNSDKFHLCLLLINKIVTYHRHIQTYTYPYKDAFNILEISRLNREPKIQATIDALMLCKKLSN